jgi:spore maturation protein CgeB
VWGAGQWVRLRGHTRNLRVENAPLFGDDYIRALCASRINLCFLRKMNRDLQTDRTMELPACGAFMLAERTPEHLRLFAEGREAAYFGSDAELVRTVQYYLDHEKERAAIAAAGRRRCLESGYSHHERLRRMLDVVHGGAMGTPETFVAGELRCRPA